MSRVSDKPYFVYVLWSKSASRFYIGISESPEIRSAAISQQGHAIGLLIPQGGIVSSNLTPATIQ